MEHDSSILKEIEEKVEEMRKDFIEKVRATAAKNEQIASLKKSDDLFKLNRRLCFYRCFMEEVPDSSDKERVIRKIVEVDKAIFSALHYPEPKNFKIHYHD